MTVAATSNITASLPQPSDARQSFSQLVSAIRSGDLDAAQSAYSDFNQTSASKTGPLAQTVGQIGDALQSGDIGQAQQALASLQQQAKGAHHHGGHHGGGGGKAETAPALPNPSAATPSSSTSLDITA
ncbi:MAG: hypothetical protein JWR80_7786 [Bradyrhizobium sp.]|nr:hypothetical protein [Bradyrhizobium sp.]